MPLLLPLGSVPLTTVSVYVGCVKFAVTVTAEAGMVMVVAEEFALATLAPDVATVQSRKDCPAGGLLAVMLTVAPAT